MDSVRLMKVAQLVRSYDGVTRADVVMGTAANLAALGADVDASPTDVVIAVDGGGDGALDAAEAELAAPAGERPGRDRAAALAAADPARTSR